MSDWISCKESLPDNDTPVLTKIDDASGLRNECVLYRGGENGRLWFLEDGSMYVYYEPTHWKPLPASPGEGI